MQDRHVSHCRTCSASLLPGCHAMRQATVGPALTGLRVRGGCGVGAWGVWCACLWGCGVTAWGVCCAYLGGVVCGAGLLWYQRPSTAIGIREELGLIFFMCLFWGCVPMLTTIITFTENRKVVRKELEDGVYTRPRLRRRARSSTCPLRCSRPPSSAASCTGWRASTPGLAALWPSPSVLILETLVASSWGFFIGAVSSTVYQAIGTATLVQLLSIMVVHFLMLDPPAWIAWSQYLSFSAYAYRVRKACLLLLPSSCLMPRSSSTML